MNITPNIQEAECLGEIQIEDKNDMEEAAIKISKFFSGNILIKGGHLLDSSDDLLYTNGEFIWFKEKKIDNPNTHGTGCTLSSAVACNLAKGLEIKESITKAKKYVTGALNDNLNLGRGRGPLNHCWNLNSI